MLKHPVAKPKLLVLELWGLGDLVIVTPFLQAAAEKYEVTLLAKPYALDLQRRFWPSVHVAPFIAPWTAFLHKYRLWRWPWLEIFRLHRLVAQKFDFGASARWDPRDHLLLRLVRARRRLGFPRMHSQTFLTDPLPRPGPEAHRHEYWRALGQVLGLDLPPREKLALLPRPRSALVVIHTGAGQPVRVWPLDRYRNLVLRLRRHHYQVQVACDPDQRAWWLNAGEPNVSTPRSVTELVELADRAAAFIGNDSGPSHVAAFCGAPTFTLFGPQLPERFAPLHPRAEWLEGKPCPYKPCSDYCRFAVAYCMDRLTEDEVCARALAFLARHVPSSEIAPNPQPLPSPA